MLRSTTVDSVDESDPEGRGQVQTVEPLCQDLPAHRPMVSGSGRDVVSTRNACVSEHKHDPGRSILRERPSPQRGENPNTCNTALVTEE